MPKTTSSVTPQPLSRRWEPINGGVVSYRLRVPGGWALYTRTGLSEGGVSTLFIADPGHTWVLED